MTEDYTQVTEVPGSGATKEQLERLLHRYHMARQYSEHKRVLEVACGAGFGLGYLSQKARGVVGGDFTLNLLKIAHQHYTDRIPLILLDGQRLPFHDKVFDVILMFEAIYYLADAGAFIREALRLLDDEGLLLIVSVNREWDEFAPSPFSMHYFSISEFRDLLEGNGFSHIDFFGAFPTNAKTLKHKAISLIRRLVVALDLMPKTLEGREKFKKIFYGKLDPIPCEISEGMAELNDWKPISSSSSTNEFKVIYCLGQKQ